MIVFRKTVWSSSANGTSHVLLAPDDEDALAGVTVGVRMFQDVEHIATLDVEDDVLESDAALRPELRVFRVVPVEGTSLPSA